MHDYVTNEVQLAWRYVMSWDLDTPNLPFKKPKQLEVLEEMTLDQREAMDPVEVKEHIHGIAASLAENCKKENEKNREWCQMIIHKALQQTGAALGGKFGATMVALSDEIAEDSIKEAFGEEI